MLSFVDPDPAQALLTIALAVGAVALAIVLWFQLLHRSRRFGGGVVAAAVMMAAVAVLLVAITPDLLPIEVGLLVLLVALAAILRPEQVVRATGGPSLRYRALREGRELQLLVRQHGGPSAARSDDEILGRVAGLAAFEGPGTERYVGLLRETLLADPGGPGMSATLADLAAADAELRASLKARPMFERELEKRAAAMRGPDAG